MVSYSAAAILFVIACLLPDCSADLCSPLDYKDVVTANHEYGNTLGSLELVCLSGVVMLAITFIAKTSSAPTNSNRATWSDVLSEIGLENSIEANCAKRLMSRSMKELMPLCRTASTVRQLRADLEHHDGLQAAQADEIVEKFKALHQQQQQILVKVQRYALSYSLQHSARVGSMVLRGIFLFDHADMAWLFEQGGVSESFPDKFERYKSIIPQGERGSLINAYYRRLTSEDEKTRLQAAAHFVEWEISISMVRALTDAQVKEEISKPSYILPFARAEAHYFVHGGWFERPHQLLDDCKSIEHIPVVVVHGRYDMVCRPRMAWELHKRLPLSSIEFTDSSGHSGMEPNTVDATIRALDKFAELPSC